jgi:hypothetical protein
MRYNTYLKRVLKPAAEAVGFEGITHQMLRRSFSTMGWIRAHRRKTFKAPTRHTEARMSLYYGKVIPASFKQKVDKLVDQTRQRPSSKATKQRRKPGENAEIEPVTSRV